MKVDSKKMARVLDGKAIAMKIKDELKVEIEKWVGAGHRSPSLRCIIVGDDPASHRYVNTKQEAAEYCGIESETVKLSRDTSEESLLDKIKEFNENDSVDAILVQLPVPETMNERRVCNAISPKKDVDGFHINNIGKLCLDMPSIVPATALGVREIIKRSDIVTHGRNAVVIGRSKNVSMPIAMMLHTDKRHDSGLGMDATVTICHRYTPKKDLDFYCKNADIIVSAVGIPKLVTADMIKPGTSIIDVGINQITDAEGKSKLVGDVDYDEVSKVPGVSITPVPGGVGPMTVAMLMYNTLQVAKLLRDKAGSE
ncbi:bifunctional methylenetetrahydrofolate dehydrogenase/cyclohydrolase, mitochondrial-like [Aphomia sociella]